MHEMNFPINQIHPNSPFILTCLARENKMKQTVTSDLHSISTATLEPKQFVHQAVQCATCI